MDLTELHSEIVTRMDFSAKENREAHQAIVDRLDLVQNGNGVIGTKQMAREWTDFKATQKTKKALMVERGFAVALVVFNVALGVYVAKVTSKAGEVSEKMDKAVSLTHRDSEGFSVCSVRLEHE